MAGTDLAMILASGIHEIKNLLFLLLDDMEKGARQDWARPPQTQDALASLQDRGQLIAHKLTRLLASYRMDAGQYPLQIEYHDVNALLQEIALEITPFLSRRALSVEFADVEGLYAFFDRELIRNVLMDGVINALKYARNVIRVEARAQDGYLVLAVLDDGPGFPPDILAGGGGARARPSPEQHGSGLGLFFAQQVASRHRQGDKEGELRLQNKNAPDGALFELWLP